MKENLNLNDDAIYGEATSSRFDNKKIKRQNAASPRYMSDTPMEQTRANLPHWSQGETCIFVTFRLADSIPKEKRIQWGAERDEWMGKHPQPWDENTSIEYNERFGGKLEQWLDDGFGSCVLKDSCCREIIERALSYFDGQRYILYAFVVMPNHVHMILVLNNGENNPSVPFIIGQFKRGVTKEIRTFHPCKLVWQRSFHDHIIRNQMGYEKIWTYINNYPLKWEEDCFFCKMTGNDTREGWKPSPTE